MIVGALVLLLVFASDVFYKPNPGRAVGALVSAAIFLYAGVRMCKDLWPSVRGRRTRR